MKVLENIKRVRKLKGISQKEMANRLNISISTYQKIEQHSILLSVERFIEICQILKINSYNELLPEVSADIVFQVESVINANYKVLGEIEGFALSSQRLVEGLIDKLRNKAIKDDQLIEELEFLINYLALIKGSSSKVSYQTITVKDILDKLD